MLVTTIPKGKAYIHRVLTTMKPPFSREVDLRMMVLLFARHSPQREETVVGTLRELTGSKFSEEEIEEAVDKAVEEGYLKEWE